MPRTVRNAAFCVFYLLGLTACGFFSEEHRELPASKRAAAAPFPPASLSNYPAFTAEQWLNLSRTLYSDGKYLESIGAAQTALHLKPDYPEAYNNIGAAYGAMRLWDPAIHAGQQAVRLAPGLQLSRNNLAWALQQKSLEKR
jgi:tetratricopeptide (TPR) repeat protein